MTSRHIQQSLIYANTNTSDLCKYLAS